PQQVRPRKRPSPRQVRRGGRGVRVRSCGSSRRGDPAHVVAGGANDVEVLRLGGAVEVPEGGGELELLTRRERVARGSGHIGRADVDAPGVIGERLDDDRFSGEVVAGEWGGGGGDGDLPRANWNSQWFSF